jgi:hypothetical protein
VISILLVSCSAGKEMRSEKAQIKMQNSIQNQAEVQNAIESRRYIVKLERLYLNWGILDLKPRANYIIVDGEKAVISAAYFGRQYDIRPIAGINIRGITKDYELTRKESKGLYEIKMKVDNGPASFDVYLTVGKNGSVSASMNSLKISNVRYRGYIVPIRNKEQVPPLQNMNVI